MDTEERILALEQKDMQTSIAIASISTKVNHIDAAISELVTKDRFAPVAYIAYGLAGGVLTTFIGAVSALVFLK